MYYFDNENKSKRYYLDKIIFIPSNNFLLIYNDFWWFIAYEEIPIKENFFSKILNIYKNTKTVLFDGLVVKITNVPELDKSLIYYFNKLDQNDHLINPKVQLYNLIYYRSSNFYESLMIDLLINSDEKKIIQIELETKIITINVPIKIINYLPLKSVNT